MLQHREHHHAAREQIETALQHISYPHQAALRICSYKPGLCSYKPEWEYYRWAGAHS